ncbi:MAG: hypothetical protein ACM3O3_07575 [Syntrophothermus sp.]
MTGKATLIMVIGFSFIFIVVGYLWGNVATRSAENHVSYYKNTIARNIAVSGANLALNQIIRDSNWVSDISDRPFENGEMTVTITPLGPPIRILESVGTFMGAEQKVRVKLQRGTRIFAEYAWFIPSVSTGSLNRPWITGDTVFGAFHTNQFLLVDGNPVFTGHVTSLKGVKDVAKPGPSNPQFLGGYEGGVQVSWNSEMSFPEYAADADEGVAMGGTCKFQNTNVWLTFNDNGTVTYRTYDKTGDDSSKFSAPVTRSLSEMAPTGVIYAKGGNLFISGTLDGSVTIISEGSSGGGNGNVTLVGDLVYKVDPMISNGNGGYMPNPACDDLMGVIATNNIIIATSQLSGGKANNVDNPDIHIDAGLFAVKGGMQVQDLGTAPANKPLGSIYLQGSMTAGKEEIVAQFNGTTITAGYNRHIIFDSRFSVAPPSWYTYTYYYSVISWLE